MCDQMVDIKFSEQNTTVNETQLQVVSIQRSLSTAYRIDPVSKRPLG